MRGGGSKAIVSYGSSSMNMVFAWHSRPRNATAFCFLDEKRFRFQCEFQHSTVIKLSQILEFVALIPKIRLLGTLDWMISLGLFKASCPLLNGLISKIAEPTNGSCHYVIIGLVAI